MLPIVEQVGTELGGWDTRTRQEGRLEVRWSVGSTGGMDHGTDETTGGFLLHG